MITTGVIPLALRKFCGRTKWMLQTDKTTYIYKISAEDYNEVLTL